MPDADVPQRHATTDPAATLDDALRRLFGDMDAAVREGIRRAAVTRAVRGGEVLFREGDAGDAAYVVLGGRLRSVAGPAGAERRLSDAVRGEIVGEVALLTGSLRSATVYAVRDTTVARLETAAFDGLLDAHPQAALPILRLLAERLRRATAVPPIRPPDDVIVAVLPLGGVDAARFSTGLAAALRPILPAVAITSAAIASAPATAPTAAPRGRPHGEALERIEAATPVAIYVGEPEPGAWNDAILRRADEILLVADADRDPARTAVEAPVLAPRERGGPRVTLVLAQPAGRNPEGTARWLDPRPGVAHLHVRAGDEAELARVGRWVTGRSVGLVLGGGGARGWAHVGVMEALREAGVPIDLVGGTSQGALVGAAFADRLEPGEIRRMAVGHIERVRDYTAPLVSLLRGRRILDSIRFSVRRGAAIEDLWLPYFAVATNLSRSEVLVLDRGPVVDAIRASVSLPMILPPVVRDGELVVDGGLLDNLPVGPMRARMPTGPIVAVDPSPARAPAPFDPIDPDVSGWRLLLDRLRGRRRAVPGIGDVAMRTLLAGSLHLRRGRAPDHDLLLLEPELGDWPLLDFGSLAPIADLGYQGSRDAVAAWWASRRAGILPDDGR